MAKILVYNAGSNVMETYNLTENSPMPYNAGGTLLVREFRGTSSSPTLWTTKTAMQSWNGQRSQYGRAIPVGSCFVRPWEGGHTAMSQHYAGVAFDVGLSSYGWTNAQRAALRSRASVNGLWHYVEPLQVSSTWVHFDHRFNPPACNSGYPTLHSGARGTYVLVMQDCLNTLGFSTNGLDGRFGNGTYSALQRFQRSQGLSADGICGCKTWTRLTNMVVGRGRTSSTID